MIHITLEPVSLTVDQANKLEFKLTNLSDRHCTNIIFKPSFPSRIVSLGQEVLFKIDQLKAGDTACLYATVRPRSAGQWTIGSRNFSYRDGYGRSHRVKDLSLSIKSHIKEPVQPPPSPPPPPSTTNFNESGQTRRFKFNPHIVKKILIMASNPDGGYKRSFDQEVFNIKEGIKLTKHRDKFIIESQLALTTKALRRAMLEHEPHIVHLIGEGDESGLMVEGVDRKPVYITAQALTGLFALCDAHLKCVILNIGFTHNQVVAIKKHIDYVIGMPGKIDDKVAIVFAGGFYDALGSGKDVETSFKFGKIAVDLECPDLANQFNPVLMKRFDDILNPA